jgi:hypothetical protein
MRADEILYESRGVTARQPGETYVSDIDPSDVLTMVDVGVLPSDSPAFSSVQELDAALAQVIPSGAEIVYDNTKNNGTLAAAIAQVTDSQGQPQYWVRYIKEIPPKGIHGLWLTLRGYKYGKGAKEESIPIKPADIVTDENYRNTDQLAQIISNNVAQQVRGTDHEALSSIIEQAVQQARAGTSTPIVNGMEYVNVLGKYAGEYLGPLALIDATGSVGGNTQDLLRVFQLSSFAGSQVMFPQDKQMELIDSIIKTPGGQEIQISSKVSKGGGAASSLSGVYKQLQDAGKKEYPRGAEVMRLLATENAATGPLLVAKMYGIINDVDIQALKDLDRGSRNPDDLRSPKLRTLLDAQATAPGALDREDYRVFFHVLAAIVTAMIKSVNADDDFKGAMMSALNNNKYVQLNTRAGKRGNDIVLDYYTKFPAVFEGSPVLYNKTYFASGQKGRIGFKLK